MLVYRVEHKQTGIGPYHNKTSSLYKMKKAHSDEEHPSWWIDLIAVNVNYYAGFSNPNELISWFSGFFSDLKKEGFHVAIYEVYPENVEIGLFKKQLAFKDGIIVNACSIPKFLMKVHNETLSQLQ